MTDKKNCWEHKQCGRQPGGNKVNGGEPCPASTATAVHGTNNGINGGRACWAINGTHCDDAKQGSYSEKLGKCLRCDFFETVRQEQGPRYQNSRQIINTFTRAEEPAT